MLFRSGENSFNEENFKFVIDSNKYVTEAGAMFKIKFKAKDTITENTKTIVKIKGVSASGGYGIITSNDSQLEVGIVVEENITSEKYDVNKEENSISKIAINTTVGQFKENVTTKQAMEFTDIEGNILNDNSVLGTGMKVKVGKTLEYTIIVSGEIGRAHV